MEIDKFIRKDKGLNGKRGKVKKQEVRGYFKKETDKGGKPGKPR